MKKLYHYTTVENLVKILRQGKGNNFEINLRATHYKYLNDIQEIELGAKILDRKILPLLHRSSQNDMIIGYLKSSLQFITSFSVKGDYLPMWHMYGNSGDGVALEFCYDNFACGLSNNDFTIHNNILQKCSYNDKEVIDAVKHAIKNNNGNEITKAITRLLTLKHRAFSYEEEYRLCAGGKIDGYFVRNSLIVPYKEHFISPKCLTGIIVGPSINQRIIKTSISDYLSLIGACSIPVRTSKTPFRKV